MNSLSEVITPVPANLSNQIRAIASKYHGRLDSNGLWNTRESRLHYYRTFPSLIGLAEARKIADRNRQEVFSESFEQMVRECIDHINNCKPIQSKKYMSSSYRWKHIVENSRDRYIGNGAFIVAAIISEVKLIHQPQNFSPLIGLSTKGVYGFAND